MAFRNAKLHIGLLVKNFSSTGGSERYAHEVAHRLVRRGHKIDLYTWQAEPDLVQGINVCLVPNRWRFSSAFNLFSYTRLTAGLLRNTSYDVIHSHESGHLPQDISTLHSFSFRGSGFQEYSFIKKLLQVYLSPRSWLHLRLEAGQMAAPHLVAVSRAIQADTEKYYKRTQDVEIISPGVDTAWFEPNWVAGKRLEIRGAESIAADELVVLFVGSEFRRKGLDRLIPAIGPGMRLVVVGRGERLGRYKSLVKEHGLADRVQFKGLCEDVRPYYAMADVVVLPSRSEAFGMTVLEGMACGLPVIVSANAGAAGLIREGENGFLGSTPQELTEILRRLRDKELRQRIGLRARETAEKCDWDRVADAYEELYRKVAAEKVKK